MDQFTSASQEGVSYRTASDPRPVKYPYQTPQPSKTYSVPSHPIPQPKDVKIQVNKQILEQSRPKGSAR